jgi:hypothetical protein
VKQWIFCMMSVSLMVPVYALAVANDELWEVSAKMDIPGMPMAMPAQTVKVCMKKGNENDPNVALPKSEGQDCKMGDVKVSGNTTSWTLKCTGDNPMTGSGEMTSGNGTYTGKLLMHAGDGDMTMAYEGKRIGTCQAK